jgi:hypothetical protein
LPGTILPRSGEMLKAVPGGQQTLRGGAGRARIKLLDVCADELKMTESRSRPYDLDQRRSGFGHGNSSGAPQDLSHSATLSWVTKRPASTSASATASRRASSASSGLVSKIDLALGSCHHTVPADP